MKTPKKVLWVDDHPRRLSDICRKLEGLAPVSFTFSSTVSNALSKLEESLFSLVIVDILLPAGDLSVFSAEDRAVVESYGRRAGLGLVSLLSSEMKTDRLSPRLVISSGYLIESLSRDRELMEKSGAALLPIVDIRDDPTLLLGYIDGRNETENPSRENSEVGDDEIGRKESDSQESAVDFPVLFATILHSHFKVAEAALDSIDKSMGLLGPRNDVSTVIQSSASDSLFLKEAIAKLEAALDQLIRSVDCPEERQVPAGLWSRLLELRDRLNLHRSDTTTTLLTEIGPDLKQSWSLFDHLAKGYLAREKLRSAKFAATKLARLIVLYNLKNAWQRVSEMLLQAQTTKDYIANGIRTVNRTEICSIGACARKAVNDISPYAESRGISLELRVHPGNLRVTGNRDEIVRAIRNVVENGLKYNYLLVGDTKAWVTVDVSREGKNGLVSVESWGVKISEEEISEELIFQEGYRGPFATAQGIPGTGLGLADTFRIIQNHKGTIEVDCRPARQNDSRANPPYITTFLLRWPI